MSDFALTWLDGTADLSIVDDDVKADDGLRTAVSLSIYLDRRAEEGDVIPDGTDDRRGYWADEFLPDANDRIGSRLWLLERSKITEELRPLAEFYLRECLAWMITDGVVREVGIETEIVLDRLYYLVTLARPQGDPVLFRFPHVWDGEAEQESVYGPPGGRVYPGSSTEWVAAFPTITTPSAIWPMQDASSPAVDTVGSSDMIAAATPVFNTTAEGGRVGVLFNDPTDVIEIASSAALDPDGVTDMTYWFRVWVPLAVTPGESIFGKRAGTGLPGFEIYIHTGGVVKVTQDGGASGRNDITGAVDHQGAWHDFAYVIDRTGLNEGRIETGLETSTASLSAITSLASTMGLAFGRIATTGRNALQGSIVEYGAAWDGVALTRADLLKIWSA